MYNPEEEPEFSVPVCPWLMIPLYRSAASYVKLCARLPSVGAFYVVVLAVLGGISSQRSVLLTGICIGLFALGLLGLMMGLTYRADSLLPGLPSVGERWVDYWATYK